MALWGFIDPCQQFPYEAQEVGGGRNLWMVGTLHRLGDGETQKVVGTLKPYYLL